MLDDKFEFKLHENVWQFEDDNKIVFSAERIDSDTYRVSWEDEEGHDSVEYGVESVRAFINEGDWIILEKSTY